MAETVVDNTAVSPSIITGDAAAVTTVNVTKGPNYILIGVLVIVLLVLLYYGYSKFSENKEEDFTDKKNKKKLKKASKEQNEREDNLEDDTHPKKKLNKVSDDTVIDYNLRESIDELRHIQQKVMGTLSDTADI